MATSKRPKAGLGLSSALGRDQLTTRKSAKATTRKPKSTRTTKPTRNPRGEPNAR